MKARLLIAVTLGFLLVPVAQSKGPSMSVRISEQITATWTCQSQRGVPRTPEYYSPWDMKRHSPAFRAAQLNNWTLRRQVCLKMLHARDAALRTGRLWQLSTHDLYQAADMEVKRGGIYSIAWGGASPLLKSLCYEAINREFGSRASWARFVVNRESDCNPRATNTKYSSWRQQAKCIAQLIPAYHTWVDYPRCQRDLRYSVHVFVALSNRGASTGPWS